MDNTCRRPGDLEALLDLSRLSLGDLDRDADRALLASGSPPSLDLERSLLFLSSSPERERVRPRSRDLERSPPRSPRPLDRDRDFDRLRSRLGLRNRRSGHYLYSVTFLQSMINLGFVKFFEVAHLSVMKSGPKGEWNSEVSSL